MKKLKNGFLAMAIIAGAMFMFHSNQLSAQGVGGGDWVCCQGLAEGCEDMLGNTWPFDEKRTTPTCTQTQQ